MPYSVTNSHHHLTTNHKSLITIQLFSPLQATAAAVSKGDAELEHKKGKQSMITSPDMTGVQ